MRSKDVVRIAGIEFASKAAAERHLQAILNDGSIGSRLEAADSEFVEQIWLSRADKTAAYQGRLVVGFERRYRDGPEKWTRCFWAVFEDGQAVDFSFKKALSIIFAA